MAYPPFYRQVRTVAVFDPLARFLGAAPDGVIEYSYLDAVKLAGHSCPTVAGAYLMAAKGLTALYPRSLPERGAIRVALKGEADAGTTGVVARVLGLITGAAGPDGFKGIGGWFVRQNLLSFNAECAGAVRFTRLETGESVDVALDLAVVPPPPDTRALMQSVLHDTAAPRAHAAFADAWQERVRKILIDHADDPDLITLTRVESSAP